MDKYKDLSEEERKSKLEEHYHEALLLLGEDPKREGLIKTPYPYG